MICDFCLESILRRRPETTWGFHHTNLSDLEESARQGCVFCTRLAVSYLEAYGLGKTSRGPRVRIANETGEALYRWSIRRAARTSESRDYVSVTFRPLPSSEAHEPNFPPDVAFYMIPDSNLSCPPLPEELGNSTSCEQSWDQIEKWITNCVKNHPQCGGSGGWTPTRLLDVGDDESCWPPPSVRIVETAGLGIEKYATLSHCWGDGLFTTLKMDNLKTFMKEGIPWDEICRNTNFAQAIEVTRRLKVRYIWIDSLCIIQDGVGKLDWIKEAPHMQEVYRNSYCNIAASDSKDRVEGLFRDRCPSRVAFPVYEAEKDSFLAGQRWRIIPGDLWEVDLLDEPLYQRGWVFQERMLAPRILHFTNQQIFWDCAQSSACESLPAGLPRHLDVKARIDRRWRRWLSRVDRQSSGEPLQLYDFWRSAIHNYSGYNLTFQKDKLQAVWGIASIVDDAARDHWGNWGAGLWQLHLEEHLMWTVDDCMRATRPETTPDFDFPSWSWASVKGKVNLAPPLDLESNTFYRVRSPEGRNISFELQRDGYGPAAYGLASKKIMMKVHIGTAKLGHVDGLKRHTLDIGQFQIDAFPDTELVTGQDYQFIVLVARKQRRRSYEKGMPVGEISRDGDHKLFDYSGFGLLLSRVQSAKDNYFERLGAIKFSGLRWEGWVALSRACGASSDDVGNWLDDRCKEFQVICLE